VKKLSRQEKNKLRSLRIQAGFYALVFLGANWTAVYAITGSMLRAVMFMVAVALITISTRQFQQLMFKLHWFGDDYFNQFEEWLRQRETVSMKAGEDLKSGDVVYLAEDGTVKRADRKTE